MEALALARSRSYPVDVATAYERVLPAPLTEIFARRYVAFPAIREVRDQPPSWDTVGQSRTIVLADRGTMRETLTEVTPPSSFGYRLELLSGPMRPLATVVDGRWSFEPAGTGCRITWSWRVMPASVATSLLMPAFGRMWQGYARQALERLESTLLDAAD